VIGELHDELLPDHARGAKNADLYSPGNHKTSCKQKKTRRLLSIGGLLNLGSLLRYASSPDTPPTLAPIVGTRFRPFEAVAPSEVEGREVGVVVSPDIER
jgi:hypothetical protein